jgi:hypothetical protein
LFGERVPSAGPYIGLVLATSDFVFVHVPKTAGRFIRAMLHEHFDVLYEDELHPGYHDVPARFAELPAVCVIRNPWDWYVSLYHYVHKIAAREPRRVRGHLWSRVMGEGRHSFTQSVRIACGLREFDGPAPPWLKEMQRLDADYYTAVHHLHTGGSSLLDVMRFESLDTDLPAFLELHGIPVPNGLAERLRTAEPVNATRRGHYRRYYDTHTRDIVARTSHLAGSYGYAY